MFIAGTNKILVLVPTISLIQQIANEWNIHQNLSFRSMFVCSDVTTAKDAYINHSSQIGLPVTTDSKKISNWFFID